MTEDTEKSSLEEEQRIFFKIFDKYDTDENLKIDINESKMMLKNDTDVEVSHKIVKKPKRFSDGNNDGQIGLTEFVDKVQEKKEKSFRQLFRKYVDSYVNFVIPRHQRAKLKSIKYQATKEPRERYGEKGQMSCQESQAPRKKYSNSLEAGEFGRIQMLARREEHGESEVDGKYEEHYSCCPPPLTKTNLNKRAKFKRSFTCQEMKVPREKYGVIRQMSCQESQAPRKKYSNSLEAGEFESIQMLARRGEHGESEEEGKYEEHYSCCPPPIALVIMSLFQIACFVIDEVSKPDPMDLLSGVAANALIYNPTRRQECWRFLTYMFVHNGYSHLVGNLLIQVLLGIPLEMVNQGWRVLSVYFSGVAAGSLFKSIIDPTSGLAGASGGVYAIITSHMSNIILNWSEMSSRSMQLFIFFMFIAYDGGRYYLHWDQKTGYAAHFGGALAGLLVGIWVLKNVEPTEKEKYLWWIAFIIYILLMGTAIMLNIFWSDHFPGPQ